jgi:hypothetical protein
MSPAVVRVYEIRSSFSCSLVAEMLQEGVGMGKEGVVLFIGTGERQIGQGIAGINRRWNLLRRRSRA